MGRSNYFFPMRLDFWATSLLTKSLSGLSTQPRILGRLETPPDGLLRRFAEATAVLFLGWRRRRLPCGLRVYRFRGPFLSHVYDFPRPVLPLTYLTRMIQKDVLGEIKGPQGSLVCLFSHDVPDLGLVQRPCLFYRLLEKLE